VGSIAGRLKSKADVEWLGSTKLPPADNSRVKTAKYISSAVRPDQMPLEGADLMGALREREDAAGGISRESGNALAFKQPPNANPADTMKAALDTGRTL
jgi:hypothetical protein